VGGGTRGVRVDGVLIVGSEILRIVEGATVPRRATFLGFFPFLTKRIT
jgi:hypothetical protein